MGYEVSVELFGNNNTVIPNVPEGWILEFCPYLLGINNLNN